MVEARKQVLVAAGVLVEVRDGAPRVLLTRRKEGTHLAGVWEFPGGKVEPGEEPRAALARELFEELGIEAVAREPLEVTFFAYPEKDVLLLFFRAERTAASPEPAPLDVAELRWASEAELDARELPPADVDVLTKVRELLSQGPSRDVTRG
jgi:8-oxo-dGTP diphosphatase